VLGLSARLRCCLLGHRPAAAHRGGAAGDAATGMTVGGSSPPVAASRASRPARVRGNGDGPRDASRPSPLPAHTSAPLVLRSRESLAPAVRAGRSSGSRPDARHAPERLPSAENHEAPRCAPKLVLCAPVAHVGAISRLWSRSFLDHRWSMLHHATRRGTARCPVGPRHPTMRTHRCAATACMTYRRDPRTDPRRCCASRGGPARRAGRSARRRPPCSFGEFWGPRPEPRRRRAVLYMGNAALTGAAPGNLATTTETTSAGMIKPASCAAGSPVGPGAAGDRSAGGSPSRSWL